MQRQIKYVSELGRSFDTPEDAIKDDKRLPGIIATYEGDLARMEAGLQNFGGGPVTEDLKERWREAIAGYKAQWEAAQNSFENKRVKEDGPYILELRKYIGDTPDLLSMLYDLNLLPEMVEERSPEWYRMICLADWHRHIFDGMREAWLIMDETEWGNDRVENWQNKWVKELFRNNEK